MSMKPDDIPQWAWYKAESAFWNNQSCTFNASGFSDDVVSVMARAIMAAVEEEREACAKLVEDHGHSNGNIRPVHKHLATAIRGRVNPKTDKTDNEKPQE